MGYVRRDTYLARFSRWAQAFSGSSLAFAAAVGVVVVWAVSGPLFRYSDTWQLVINTGTTIVTFWMVFLIQRAQNYDSRAVHMKLDEIIAALKGASNRLIKIEELSEPELDELRLHFMELRKSLDEKGAGCDRHTIEEFLDQAEDITARGTLRRKGVLVDSTRTQRPGHPEGAAADVGSQTRHELVTGGAVREPSDRAERKESGPRK